MPTLIEHALAYRAFGAAGLYVAYVSGAICKVRARVTVRVRGS